MYLDPLGKYAQQWPFGLGVIGLQTVKWSFLAPSSAVSVSWSWFPDFYGCLRVPDLSGFRFVANHGRSPTESSLLGMQPWIATGRVCRYSSSRDTQRLDQTTNL